MAASEPKVELIFTYAENRRVYETIRASVPADKAREFGRLVDEDEDKALAYLRGVLDTLDDYTPVKTETAEADEPEATLLEWEEIR